MQHASIFPRLTLVFLACAALPGIVGCGGGGAQGGIGPGEVAAAPRAVAGRADSIGGPGAAPVGVPADYVPVSVRVIYSPNVPAQRAIVEYHVYRASADAGQVLVANLPSNGLPLTFFDDGQERPNLPGSGLPRIGVRVQYLIESRYVAEHGADGGPTYATTGRVPSNFVTYLEPTVGAQVTGDGAGGARVTVPATLSADDYVLDIAPTTDFVGAKRFTPTGNGPYTAPASAPRHGTPVVFTGLHTGQVFPGAAPLFLRVGARDSRNGRNEQINPYLYSDVQPFPTP